MQLDAVLSGGDHESAPKTEILSDYVNGRVVEIQQKAERPTGRRKTGFGVSGGKVRLGPHSDKRAIVGCLTEATRCDDWHRLWHRHRRTA